MIGQEKILKKIDSFTISTLPHSILLVGDRGSGHIEVCNYIATKFGLSLFDFTDNVSQEYITQIYTNVDPAIYICDIDKLDEKKQNVLLKLYEEPNKLSYIILYGENEYNLLGTIFSRSYVLKLEKFTRDQLLPLIKDDAELVLNIATTPGQVEICNHMNVKLVYELVNKIVHNLISASLPNTLSIANKINFSDEYDKFDLYIFMKILQYVIKENISDEYNCELLCSLYKEVVHTQKMIGYMSYKKENFENLLIRLWSLSRGLQTSEGVV